MVKTFHLISLGCAKNLVDSEVMLGALAAHGWSLVEEPEEAAILTVNTCGFIQPAVEEAIAEILALAEVKASFPDKKLVVVGCLVERYRDQLAEEFPEVDLFVGTESAAEMGELFADLLLQGRSSRIHFRDRTLMTSRDNRIITTPSFRAWLKITEGCDNRCSYCMIPAIRGPLRSRAVADLVREAQRLEASGVKELSLIGQDITAYGRDLGSTGMLVVLLQALLENTSIPWLRLLYLYPSGIDASLIRLMAENERILPYLDLPIQHVSDRVLKKMNRHYRGNTVYEVINRLRRAIPDIALRTTLLVGFPGEKEEDIKELEDLLTTVRFDHVGVFAYADEEGSGSERMKGKVPENEREQRRDYLLRLQAEISAERLYRFVNTVQPVLIEGVSEETDLLLTGRTRFQAPEVDGCVYINEGTAVPGEIVAVSISEAQVYDLVGGIWEK
jgi:ribosomal protein S12 methylthiotransferase